jgi:hypothetical protein
LRYRGLTTEVDWEGLSPSPLCCSQGDSFGEFFVMLVATDGYPDGLVAGCRIGEGRPSVLEAIEERTRRGEGGSQSSSSSSSSRSGSSEEEEEEEEEEEGAGRSRRGGGGQRKVGALEETFRDDSGLIHLRPGKVGGGGGGGCGRAGARVGGQGGARWRAGGWQG